MLLVVGFILQKHVVYVYTGPNTSIRACSAIHHGWLCVPCEIADDKGSGLFISRPLGLVSSRGLRAAIALSREGLARVWIRVKLRMTKGVVSFFPYRSAIWSGLTYIILGAIRTYLQY